jgi:hypothetical protein
MPLSLDNSLMLTSLLRRIHGIFARFGKHRYRPAGEIA